MKKYRPTFQKNKTKGGFTLVELIVTLAILAILMGGAIMGLSAYQKHAMYLRNNEYAQSLFAAAQSGLTHYKANGQLEDLQALFNDNGTLKGNVLNLGSIQGDDETINKIKQSTHVINYLRIQGGDLSGAEAEALYALIGDYVYDPSVLNASISVEMDVMDGVVYSVCYSDRASSFVYSGGSDSAMNICDRSESRRKDIILGYYSTSLSERAPSSYEKTSLNDVTLVNDETLDLKFNMTKKYQALTNDFLYTVQLYDADKNLRATFDVNDKKAGNLLNSGDDVSNAQITTAVTFYQDGEPIEPKQNCTIRVYADTNYVIHLTLDGLDLKAAELVASNNEDAAYQDTYSIRRFGFAPGEKLYARVQVSGGNFKPSAWKQSDIESAYFADVQTTTTDNATTNYTIRNARHLFNIRFSEQEEAVNTYTQKSSFAWGGTDGIVAHGKVYNQEKRVGIVSSSVEGGETGDQIVDKNTLSRTADQGTDVNSAISFPAIPELKTTSTYQGVQTSAERNSVIKELVINEKTESNTTPVTEENVGLFKINNGTVQYVVLDNPQITSKGAIIPEVPATGTTTTDTEALLGKQSAQDNHMLQTTALDRSAVLEGDTSGESGTQIRAFNTLRAVVREGNNSGNETVTGAGAVCGVNHGALSNITVVNGTITGSQNVGGVAGVEEVISNTTTPSCDNLVSSAAVSGTKNIGGILGNNIGGNITDCSSAPQDLYDLSSLQTERNGTNSTQGLTLAQVLRGVNAGGIVGYSNGGTISGCKTTGGYIVGSEYVGGIAGRIEGETSGVNLSGGADSEKGINSASVIGNRYVGGILGSNESANGTVSNWVNEGLVAATSMYSGGITGYNAGTLENCTSDVNTSVESGQSLLAKAAGWGQYGDYAGGIAGYNAPTGKITSTEKQSVSTVTAGHNYVGGIVGYNDKSATINNYEVTGGYISGSCFVSGYVGLNASTQLFNESRVSSPNKVEGKWFVGGIAGANLLPTNENVAMTCDTNNFLGSIHAEGAFAGGFIGVNALMTEAAEDVPAEADPVLTLANSMAAVVLEPSVSEENSGTAPQEDTTLTTEQISQYCQAVVKVLNENTGLGSTAAMTLNGTTATEGTAASGNNELNQISAPIYVAGIVAYNAGNTKLYITNITNKTRVAATTYVTDTEDVYSYNDKAVDGAAYIETVKRYSFAGGIIGTATANVTITNCKNQDAGEITGQGTYHGGLVEVNEGIIQDCVVQTFGENNWNYVGGIAGVNGISGEILGCRVSGTVTGSNCVGGLTAENYGSISYYKAESATETNSSLTGTVRANGTDIGGLVGRNRYGAKLTGAESSGKVEGNGTNVGGYVGRNEGSIGNVDTETVQGTAITNTSTVSGKANVGGFVGLQFYLAADQGVNQNNPILEQTLTHLDNKASVTAQEGAAGGIAGAAEGGQYYISYCSNTGDITSVKSGAVGGIISNNAEKCTLENCSNSGNVTARTKGNAGGITAVNAGTIQNCSVKGNSNSIIDISGNENVGGITAENEKAATISNTTITYGNIYNQGGKGKIGGFAGINKGTITLTETAAANTVVSTFTDQSEVGGVAGNNAGTISKTETETETANAVLQMTVKADNSINGTIQANIGGVAGTNEGTITGITFSGTINGNGDQDHGIGGIVGINGSKSRANAKINTCKMETGFELKTAGAMSSLANVGGAAGINYRNAEISNVDIYPGTISSDYSCTGGMVGHNYGSISDFNLKDNDNVSGKISIRAGHIGGMVGYNDDYGKLTAGQVGESTATKWSINASEKDIGDNTAGGCIGYNTTGEDIDGLTNYASVTKTAGNSNSVSGIIGRQEVQLTNAWVIENCKNYGTVKGNERSAGLIGQWKYKGGTIKNCENYGNITSSGSVAGGMVGKFYMIDANQPIVFENCINFGTIKASGNVAGLIGQSDNVASGTKITLTDCINVGLIDSTSACAGIVANSNGSQYTLVRCRNYGSSTGTNFSGIASGSNSFTMQNCFGVASHNDQQDNNKGVKYPIAEKASSSSSNNYYFGNEVPGEVAAEIDRDNVTMNSNQGNVSGVDPSLLTDGKDYTIMQATISNKNDAKLSIIVPLVAAAEVDAVNITWLSNEINKYSYSIQYSTNYDAEDETGNWTDLYVDQKNATAYTRDVISGIGKITAIQIIVKSNDAKVSIAEISLEPKGASDVAALADEAAASSVRYGVGEPLTVVKYSDNNYSAQNVSSDMMILQNMRLNPNTSEYKLDAGNKNNACALEMYNALDELGSLNKVTSESETTLKPIPKYYYDFYYSSSLSDPTNIKVENLGGTYKISWTNNTDAYGARVVAKVYEEESGGTPINGDGLVVQVYGTNCAYLSIPDEWAGKYLEISVQLLSVNPQNNSGIVTNSRTLIPATLPTPVVSFHLISENTAGTELQYVCVLENPEEFEKYPDCTIKTTWSCISGGSISFKANAKQSTPVVCNSVDSKIMTAQASLGSGASAQYSRTSSGQTTMLKKANLIAGDGKNNTDIFKGFTGQTPNEMGYTTVATFNSNIKPMNYRTEYQVFDEKLQMWVGQADALAYVTDRQTSVTSKLSGLSIPEDVSKMRVLFYPWSSQNDLVQYAYYAAKGIDVSAAGKPSETDSEEDGNTYGQNVKEILQQRCPEAFEGGALKDHYVLEVNQNGTYDIVYSYLINNDSYSKISRVKEFDDTTLPRVETPEIKSDYEVNGTDYTFSWDQSNTQNGSYTVELYGTLLDGTEVLITSNQDYPDKTIPVDTSDWRYKQIRLVVTRKGTLKNGYVDKLYSSAEQSWDLRVPFDTIGRPDAPQLKDNNKDELIYTINWTGLSDVQQLAELGSYEVYAVDQSAPESSDLKPIATVTRTEDGVSTTTDIDLEAYAGKRISIYVVATPSEDAAVYTDSAQGVVREFQVPSRLDMPGQTAAISKPWEAGTEDKPAVGVSVTDFEDNGLTVSIENNTTQIKYVMQAAIYSTNGTADATTPTDTTSGTVNELPDEAKRLLQITDNTGENLTLTNSAGKASRTIKNLSAEYAGNYLFVRFRATADNAISSAWSGWQWLRLPKVQVDAPSLVEKTISLSVLETIPSEPDTSENGSGTTNTEPRAFTSIRPMLEWNQVDYTKGYELTLHHLGSGYKEQTQDGDPNEPKEWQDYPITLQYKNENEFEITLPEIVEETEADGSKKKVIQYKDSQIEALPDGEDPSVYVGNETNVNLYSMELKDFSQTYTGTLANGDAYEVTIPAILQVLVYYDETTKVMTSIKYRVILPDVESLENYQRIRTGYVSVHGLPDETLKADYTPSNYSEWARIQTIEDNPATNSTILRTVDSTDKLQKIQDDEKFYFMKDIFDADVSGNGSPSALSEEAEPTLEIDLTAPLETQGTSESGTSQEEQSESVQTEGSDVVLPETEAMIDEILPEEVSPSSIDGQSTDVIESDVIAIENYNSIDTSINIEEAME